MKKGCYSNPQVCVGKTWPNKDLDEDSASLSQKSTNEKKGVVETPGAVPAELQ